MLDMQQMRSWRVWIAPALSNNNTIPTSPTIEALFITLQFRGLSRCTLSLLQDITRLRTRHEDGAIYLKRANGGRGEEDIKDRSSTGRETIQRGTFETSWSQWSSLKRVRECPVGSRRAISGSQETERSIRIDQNKPANGVIFRQSKDSKVRYVNNLMACPISLLTLHSATTTRSLRRDTQFPREPDCVHEVMYRMGYFREASFLTAESWD